MFTKFMKHSTVGALLVLFGVLFGLGIINQLFTDTTPSAEDAGPLYFESLDSTWITQSIAVKISEVKIVIAAAENEGWKHIPTTLAYNKVTGQMKVGYRPFGPIGTTFELYPATCPPICDAEILSFIEPRLNKNNQAILQR